MSRWIPVTERLPETYYLVLVHAAGQRWIAWKTSDRWELDERIRPGVHTYINPSHWMPLPEGPEVSDR
jgi:hypothetical protein